MTERLDDDTGMCFGGDEMDGRMDNVAEAKSLDVQNVWYTYSLPLSFFFVFGFRMGLL